MTLKEESNNAVAHLSLPAFSQFPWSAKICSVQAFTGIPFGAVEGVACLATGLLNY